jgi:hypothetical protein
VEPERLVAEDLAAEDLAELEPGNALAATSDSTAVSATLPAISHRLARCSRFIAASRSKRLWLTVMK